MAEIKNGYILLARKTIESEIWNKKPAWWFKVWNYLLMQCDHAANKYCKRGQCFTSRKQIYEDCHLIIEGIKPGSIDNMIRWMREGSKCTTRQTTRGFYITLLHYERYQNPENYKNDAENEVKTKQKRTRNEPIHKNVKNVKNVKPIKPIKTLCEKFEKFWKQYPKHRRVQKDKCAKKFATLDTATQDQALSALANHLTSKQWQRGVIPLSTTWLTQSRWNQDFSEEPHNNAPKKPYEEASESWEHVWNSLSNKQLRKSFSEKTKKTLDSLGGIQAIGMSTLDRIYLRGQYIRTYMELGT